MTSEQKRHIDQYWRQGMGSNEIVEKLTLSVNTVKSYCQRNTVLMAASDDGATPFGICKQCGRLMAGGQDRLGKQFCSDRCRYQWWHLTKEIQSMRQSVPIGAVAGHSEQTDSRSIAAWSLIQRYSQRLWRG